MSLVMKILRWFFAVIFIWCFTIGASTAVGMFVYEVKDSFMRGWNLMEKFNHANRTGEKR